MCTDNVINQRSRMTRNSIRRSACANVDQTSRQYREQCKFWFLPDQNIDLHAQYAAWLNVDASQAQRVKVTYANFRPVYTHSQSVSWRQIEKWRRNIYWTANDNVILGAHSSEMKMYSKYESIQRNRLSTHRNCYYYFGIAKFQLHGHKTAHNTHTHTQTFILNLVSPFNRF